ncbi:MAG: iron-sulfur cluster assembly accessory protein [Candidatus Binatia bacterium]|nr:iron-sulfur cluster assembly accessory protein [Candidatus Binatia bacterium]
MTIPDRKECDSGHFEVVRLTAVAAEQARQALARRGLEDGVLRVAVSGGGCSGMQYSLTVEAAPKPGDYLLDDQGIRVAVDEQALPYIRGTVIDYVSGLHSAGFKFLNPNATRTCGCGSSFSVGDS